MKTYVIILSKSFPKGHVREGENTFFRDQFLNGVKGYDGSIVEQWYDEPLFIDGKKLHTIRMNYPLWEKRIEEVKSGKACLSIRQWSGKPYNSEQVELARLTAEDGVGLQCLELTDDFSECIIDGKPYNYVDVAKNDGLNAGDWIDWFNQKGIFEPMAVIHFTPFRY